MMTIESTGVILTVNGVQVRLWRGVDGAGRKYDVYVHLIGTIDPAAQERMDKELVPRPVPQGLENGPPVRGEVQ